MEGPRFERESRGLNLERLEEQPVSQVDYLDFDLDEIVRNPDGLTLVDSYAGLLVLRLTREEGQGDDRFIKIEIERHHPSCLQIATEKRLAYVGPTMMAEMPEDDDLYIPDIENARSLGATMLRIYRTGASF